MQGLPLMIAVLKAMAIIKYVWQIIRTHLFSIFFYVLFFMLFVMHVLAQLEYERIKEEFNGD
jgi:hypothetical protein